jgi:hypothetical protein
MQTVKEKFRSFVVTDFVMGNKPFDVLNPVLVMRVICFEDSFKYSCQRIRKEIFGVRECI